METSKNMSILLVEDHDVQRRTMARILKGLGADVIEVDNGRPALEVINGDRHVDLVICDIDMPDMDGLAFLRNIGQSGNQTSVVICSAKDRGVLNAAYMMAKEYGVRLLGLIEKPFSRESFEKILLDQFPMLGDSSKRRATGGLDFSIDQILEGLHENQFVPFFQPKVDIKTEKPVGAEVLVRWLHPEHGIVGPNAFIRKLEERCLIEGLTLSLLTKASRALIQWRSRGVDSRLAVNISASLLSDVTFSDRVVELVGREGLDCRDFVLEITETAAMADVAPVLENLVRLRMRGFGLSIDDYGTGFSSLQQLSRIPFTELKIDKSFVTDCASSASMETIVECSIDLAHQLGLQCVAEGVETREVMDKLRTLGCDLAQGYLFAKPMEQNRCLDFLRVSGARG